MKPIPLDTNQLETFVEIGHSDYREIFEDFIHQIPLYLERIYQAIRDADSSTLRATVHSLRGMASLFGCVTLTQRLAQLEQDLEVHPAHAQHIHTELHSLWQSNLAALEAWEKSIPEFQH
jgi:HPt (histidine-containing phosphotransfer) domain-containing protein